ncbi:hypothetical protein L208DRAFT_1036978, partial [Tricholoma matsutake]
ETSTYMLELPTALQARQVVPSFHVSLLRPYHANDDSVFPNKAQPDPYNFGVPDDQEWFVEDLIRHRWAEDKNLEFEVQWSLGDTT